MTYRVVWLTEYNGKLGKDDEPSHFDTYHQAKRYMDDLIDEIKGNEYLKDRQIVKLYNGTSILDKWDSMPPKAKVMKARAKVKKACGTGSHIRTKRGY